MEAPVVPFSIEVNYTTGDVGTLATFVSSSKLLWGNEEWKLRFNGLSKLETLENIHTLFCELNDLPKLTNLHKLRLQLRDYRKDNAEEMLNYLAALGQSSTSSFRYWALDFEMHDESLLNNPNMIWRLFWNDKFNFEELWISGLLPELAELFKQ